MNDMPHSNAYANDPQFDNLTGRVTHQTSIVGMTNDGWKVKCTRVYIDIGRAAPVDAADPDAMIETVEHIPYVPLYPRRVPKTQDRVTEFQQRVMDYLTEHGPTAAAQLARDVGASVMGLQKHMYKRTGTVYCRVSFRGRAVIWGLAGIHSPSDPGE